MIGKNISHYRVLQKLGEGGMGEVYLAQDTKLNRKVALKFLPTQLASDEELRARFKREAQAAATLNHPNIITVYEVSEHENRPFIAMEYVEGESLKDLVAGKELSIGEVLDIALQISDGLAVAHQAGIVHRDIKPQNILMGKDGRVRICDFGLAKAKRDVTMTQAGSTLGTIAYMSPEQARGKETDHRSDIFSFGVVLYEMVTGRLPFKGEHEAATIHSIVNDAPEPLARYKSDVPGELQRIVGKAMEKNREMRYQHAEDLGTDLRKLKTELEMGETKTRESAIKPISSIAVLPFVNMSADPEQEYFCDGMAEEIINALTHVESLHVVARTSAFSFKGEKVDIYEIGKKLKVGHVLEGSVRKAGNRLRITAQLVNVADGYHLWSEKYDRDMEDVFAIQDEISLAIVDKLKVKLLGKEENRIAKHHTQDVDAYSLYLRGRHFWSKRTPQELQKAIEHFRQAIEKDPGYALAYAGMADCYNVLGFFAYLRPRDILPKAKAAAGKALELDDSLAEGLTSLAHVSAFFDRDWPSAERLYKQAIALNPGYATAHQWYGEFLSAMGRFEEGIAEGKRAQELDPLSPLITMNLAGNYYVARQYEEALRRYHKAIELDPYYVPAYLFLGFFHAERGDYEQARAAIQKARSLLGKDSPTLDIHFAWINALTGDQNDAERALRTLDEPSKQEYTSPLEIASVYLALGQNDQFFMWMEKADEERIPWMVFLKVWPLWDRVRSDKRFVALLKKIGLE